MAQNTPWNLTHPPGPAKGCVLEAPLLPPLLAPSPCLPLLWAVLVRRPGTREALGVPSNTQHQEVAGRRGAHGWPGAAATAARAPPPPSCPGRLPHVLPQPPLQMSLWVADTLSQCRAPPVPCGARCLSRSILPGAWDQAGGHRAPPQSLGHCSPRCCPPASGPATPHLLSAPLLPASDLDAVSLFTPHPEAQHVSQTVRQPPPQRKGPTLLRAHWALTGPVPDSSRTPSLLPPPSDHGRETPHGLSSLPLHSLPRGPRGFSGVLAPDGEMGGGGRGEEGGGHDGWRSGRWLVDRGRDEGWLGEGGGRERGMSG